jgi:hypothetical protein
MADVTLKDREIVIDLEKITIKEFRSLFDENQSDEIGDQILSRVCGLTVDEIAGLSFTEYKRLTKAFFRKAREPLADPN